MGHEPSRGELARAAQVFKALSHPDRLLLACLLAERTRATTQHELVEELGWPQSTVARHVGTLRDQGLLTGTREGAEVLLETTALPRSLLDSVCGWLDPVGGRRTEEVERGRAPRAARSGRRGRLAGVRGEAG